MRRILMLAAMFGVVAFASGCASLNSSVPFQYQPSLVSSGKQVQKTVGVRLLTDNRPEQDKAYTESIKDVAEKITGKLIEDFEKSKIFLDIHYPAKENDDLILSGTINHFMWKMYATPISYIPFLNLVMYLGVPSTEAYGVADIQIELTDRATGAVVGSFSGSSENKIAYTLYNFKAGEAGTELADSLRDVVKKLKEDVVAQLS